MWTTTCDKHLCNLQLGLGWKSVTTTNLAHTHFSLRCRTRCMTWHCAWWSKLLKITSKSCACSECAEAAWVCVLCCAADTQILKTVMPWLSIYLGMSWSLAGKKSSDWISPPPGLEMCVTFWKVNPYKSLLMNTNGACDQLKYPWCVFHLIVS